MDNQEVVSQDQESINQPSEQSSEQPQGLPAEVVAPEVVAPEAQTGPQSIKEKLGEVAAAAKAKSKASQEPEAPVPAAFQPNYKFKALDKEHEIPELLRTAIKDADSEKAVRELVLKAIGMDHIKPKYQEVRQKYEEVNTAHQNTLKGIADLRADYQKGDMDSFFEKLNIPMEKILQYAVQKVQFKELPPEQQQQIEARRNAELRANQLEQQNSQLNEQTMAHAVEAKRWSLQMVMQRPDIQSFAEAYDKARGKPGSFQEVVIRTGESAYYTRQKDLSPDEAVKEAMELIGPVARAHAEVAAPQAPTNAAPQVVPNKPKVIPNVQGKSSASPAKKAPMSTDDLRKHYRDKYAGG